MAAWIVAESAPSGGHGGPGRASKRSLWSGVSGASNGATGAGSLRLSEQDPERVRGRRDGLVA